MKKYLLALLLSAVSTSYAAPPLPLPTTTPQQKLEQNLLIQTQLVSDQAKLIADLTTRLNLLEKPDPFTFSTYKPIYNDSSLAAQENNDRAVIEFQNKLPMQGGPMWIGPGVLYISKPIKNPTRWQPVGATAYRPINFGLFGTVNSVIALRDPNRGDAVVFAPEAPTITLDGGFASSQDVRLAIRDLSFDGGGISVTGGGKSTELRNIVVSNAELGLLLKYFDAGAVHDVKVRLCKTGARFDTSMLLELDHFNPRECTGDGLQIVNCSGMTGVTNPEGNGGWQINADQLKASVIHLWAEDQSNQPTRPLVKLRRSERNIISGVDQSNGFDYDPLSKLTTKIQTAASEFPPIGDPVGELTEFAPLKGAPLLKGDATSIICDAGCYNQPSVSDGNVYGELKGFSNTVEYKKGDYLSFSCDIVASPEAVKWADGAIVFVLQPAGGTFKAKRNVRLLGTTTSIEFHGEAQADGVGVRMFAMLLPKREQPDPVKFEFKNVRVGLLHNN